MHGGNGILPKSAEFLFQSGVDVITGGNHSFKRREIYSCMEENEALLRPANFPDDCPGKGYYVYDGGAFTLLVINLQGTSFLEPIENPFAAADRILKEQKAKYTIIDFHAEATGEKKAFGYYMDGRVSAVCGTHTHVQTSDGHVLQNGTGYITDIGMTGPWESALGVRPECVINRLRTGMPTRFEIDEAAPCRMDAVLLTLSKDTGLCGDIETLQLV